jgi:hypothetical protein
MDVCYVMAECARSGSVTNELRYSLRSLVNVPHDRVVISGWTPDWAVNVKSVATRQTKTRWVNAFNNLKAALPYLSTEFLFMNDDFFVMEPFDRIPPFHRGPLGGREGKSTPYRQARESVRHILAEQGFEDPVSYELHVPIVYNRDLLADTLAYAESWLIAGYQRTLYGNLNGIGGGFMDDCKNTSDLTSPFLSTNETAFAGKLGRHIQQVFPDPSPYEG